MSSEEEQQAEVIDKELVKTSLYNLGKTFNNARHAYLSVNLGNQSLTTINVSDRIAFS
jgi:sensor c-di-GMP phosphodiesterase-like protein